MKKEQIWKLVGLSVFALYLIIWVGLAIYVTSFAPRNSWNIEKEANPKVGMNYLNNDDWCAILASSSFRGKSISERVSIADAKFSDIKSLAEEDGFDVKQLQSWLHKTATDFEKYPIKSFVFAENAKTQYYRDLSNSDFPKINLLRVFLRHLSSSSGSALYALPFAILPLALLVGIITSFASKKLALKWKILVAGLIAVCLLEAWIINFAQKQPVSLGSFNFYDDGNGYVTTEGTWSSDTKLADPLQVTKIDCWRNWNYCIESNARVSNGYLNVNTDYWEIADWGQDAITIKDRGTALCVNESLRLDRKNKVVTFARATKNPKPDSCAGIQDEPIVMHLADGIKLQYKK